MNIFSHMLSPIQKVQYFLHRSISADRIKLIETEFNDSFKVSALWVTVQLLSDFLSLWNELPSVIEIYSPLLESLGNLPISRYNNQLQDAVRSLSTSIEELTSVTRKRLIYEAKKPKLLRLYEPKVEA